jgi:hypothetical protein
MFIDLAAAPFDVARPAGEKEGLPADGFRRDVLDSQSTAA